MARKLICDFFSANYEDHELYFDEFQKQGAIYRSEAKSIPENKDGHKNRICSANGLDALNAMAPLLSPILTNCTLNSNLKGKKDAILKNGVRLGAIADILLFRDAGVTQVGFLKFNFTAKKLSKEEAEIMLFVLQTFFESKGVTLNPDSCFLIDVFAWRIYTPGKKSGIEKIVDKSTIEIRDSWDSI